MSSHPPLLDLVADDLNLVEAKMQATNEVFQPLAGAINLLLHSGGKRIRPSPADPLVNQYDAEGLPLAHLPADSAARRAVAALVDRILFGGRT